MSSQLSSVKLIAIIIFAILAAGMLASPDAQAASPIGGLTPGRPLAQGTSISLPPCSATIHGLFSVVGPDGQSYPTWHPQLDFKHQCFFNHEHGSDPSLFSPGYGESWAVHPGWPLFGYTATTHGMTEPNAGFKVYVYSWRGFLWMVTQHQGTASAMVAACNRHHTLDIAMRDSTGALVVNIHTMGDYGRAVANTAPVAGQPLPDLVPAACPTQAADAAGSNGVRQFPVTSLGNGGYEPWRADTSPNEFGFSSGGLTIQVGASAKTACKDLACSENVTRYLGAVPHNGSFRTVEMPSPFGFTDDGPRGTFTDSMGAVQFIADGLVLHVEQPGPHCYPFGDSMLYVCDTTATVNGAGYQLNPFITGGN